jgi:hypothetical protein
MSKITKKKYNTKNLRKLLRKVIRGKEILIEILRGKLENIQERKEILVENKI